MGWCGVRRSNGSREGRLNEAEVGSMLLPHAEILLCIQFNGWIQEYKKVGDKREMEPSMDIVPPLPNCIFFRGVGILKRETIGNQPEDLSN